MSATRPPQYSRQRCKGKPDRAYTRINGKRVYLGRFGSQESRAKYAEVLNRAGKQSTEPITAAENPTVSELLVQFLIWAKGHYQESSEYANYRGVAKILRQNFGDLPAKDFGPRKLKESRQAMIDKGWSRKSINKQVVRMRGIFGWAVGEELIPATNLVALQAVKGLRKGRTNAKESKPVRPVPEVDIHKALMHLPQVLADMVKVQLLTGMRGGELVQMRPCDVDRSDKVWIYRPAKHKTQHRDKDRAVAIGPRAQKILLSYLARDSKMYLFRPCDSEAKRLAAISAARMTPLSCGNRPGSNCVGNPKRSAGEAYSTDSYRRAIHRACKRAGVSSWTPHQLRHNAATEARREFGLEAAQVILGHANARITEVYAERDLAKAAEFALHVG